MQTEIQKLADKRNAFKGYITQSLNKMKAISKSSSAYSSERRALTHCHSLLEDILADFKKYHPLRNKNA